MASTQDYIVYNVHLAALDSVPQRPSPKGLEGFLGLASVFGVRGCFVGSFWEVHLLLSHLS